jgi:hypothetical protein
MIGDASEDVGQPGLRIDVVRLGCDDERAHNAGPLTTAIGSGGQSGQGSILLRWSTGLRSFLGNRRRCPSDPGERPHL